MQEYLTGMKWPEASQSCLTLCDPMDCSSSIRGIFLGKNTGMGCHFLLQGIFLTQESNPGLLYCRQILYHCAINLITENFMWNSDISFFVCFFFLLNLLFCIGVYSWLTMLWYFQVNSKGIQPYKYHSPHTKSILPQMRQNSFSPHLPVKYIQG